MLTSVKRFTVVGAASKKEHNVIDKSHLEIDSDYECPLGGASSPPSRFGVIGFKNHHVDIV